MTEKEIQNALWERLRLDGHEWICPNYTPKGWWECDMFSLTKAGYFVEHEIKLTVSDFRADATKMKTINRGEGFGFCEASKHALLGGYNLAGPSRFFYVAPEGLLTAEQMPTWAGLIEARYTPEWDYDKQESLPTKRVSFSTLKEAPKLHKQKVDPKVMEHLASIFYWRFWNLRRGK